MSTVLASHLRASAQMMLPDLTQQKPYKSRGLADAHRVAMSVAMSVTNAWALTRPLSRPVLYVQSRDGGTDFACARLRRPLRVQAPIYIYVHPYVFPYIYTCSLCIYIFLLIHLWASQGQLPRKTEHEHGLCGLRPICMVDEAMQSADR
jgi:hypothetical protein